MATICKFRSWPIAKDVGGNTTVDVLLHDGVSHRISLVRQTDPGGLLTFRFIADICHESEVDDPSRLLQESGFMNHGVFAIMNRRLVVLDTQIDQTADIEEVAAILTHLASYARRFLNKLSLKKHGKLSTSVGQMKGGPHDPSTF